MANETAWTPIDCVNDGMPGVRGGASHLDLSLAASVPVDPALGDLKLELLRNLQAALAADPTVLAMRRLRARLADAVSKGTPAGANLAELEDGRDQHLQADDPDGALVLHDAARPETLAGQLQQATDAAMAAILTAARQAVKDMAAAIKYREGELCRRLDEGILDELSRLVQRREALDGPLGAEALAAAVLQT